MLMYVSRLRDLLLSRGQGLVNREEIEVGHYAEAKIDWESSEPFVLPPECDYTILQRFKEPRDEGGYGYHFGELEDPDSPYNSCETVSLGEHTHFDFLWLSTTEFVTSNRYLDFPELQSFVRCSYCVGVQLKGVEKRLEAYTVRQFEESGKEIKCACHGLALRFVALLLTPVLDEVMKIHVRFEGDCPVKAALSLVPTLAQTMVEPIIVSFVNPNTEFLEAVADHPFHRQVILSFPYTRSGALSNALRNFKRPVHLQVSCELKPNKDEEAYTCNPAITAITIDSSWRIPSDTILDGIAHNKSIRNLTIVFVPGSIDSVFSRVMLRSCCSVQSLTVVFAPRKPQHAVDLLSEDLDSLVLSAHSLTRFCVRFPNMRRQPPMKSNRMWDSRFSPALLLNYLRSQPGGNPSKFPGLAVQSINRGVLYKCASSLVACDLTSSSAGVIFGILRQGSRRRVPKKDPNQLQNNSSAICKFTAAC
jgi:hypothetical protein